MLIENFTLHIDLLEAHVPNLLIIYFLSVIQKQISDFEYLFCSRVTLQYQQVGYIPFFFFFKFYAHAILSSCRRRACFSFYIPWSNLLITNPKSRPAIGLLCGVKVVDRMHSCCLKWHFLAVWQLFNSCLLKQYWGPPCTTETLHISQVLNTYNMVV